MKRRRRRTHPGPAGFLIVNKPVGVTARSVLDDWLKRIPGKAGMEGVLDPFADGLLIFGFGNATRYLAYFHTLPKEYETTLQLGTETDSLDMEGEVIRQLPVPELSIETIQEKTSHLLGTQMQTPPIFSNIKTGGKRAHVLAREGQEVKLKDREVTILAMEFHNYDMENHSLRFTALTSAGTYIRALGRDIAQALGTIGHLSALRRTRIGPFILEEAITPVQIEACGDDKEALTKLLVPAESMLRFMPKINVNSTQREDLFSGRYLDLAHQPGLVRLYCDEEFLGIGEALGEKIKPERLEKAYGG